MRSTRSLGIALIGLALVAAAPIAAAWLKAEWEWRGVMHDGTPTTISAGPVLQSNPAVPRAGELRRLADDHVLQFSATPPRAIDLGAAPSETMTVNPHTPGQEPTTCEASAAGCWTDPRNCVWGAAGPFHLPSLESDFLHGRCLAVAAYLEGGEYAVQFRPAVRAFVQALNPGTVIQLSYEAWTQQGESETKEPIDGEPDPCLVNTTNFPTLGGTVIDCVWTASSKAKAPSGTFTVAGIMKWKIGEGEWQDFGSESRMICHFGTSSHPAPACSAALPDPGVPDLP